MQHLVIHLAAKNDRNGNPRRAFVILNPADGSIVETIEEGYRGTGAWRGKYPDAVQGPRFESTPSEIRLLLN